MAITFQTESWATYRRDCDALWAEHYEELARFKSWMKMKPDEPAYEAMDASGALHILTVRDDGALVGYITSVIRAHLHYADTLCAFEDAYVLAQTHRKGWSGYKMFKAWLACMRERGVRAAFCMTKPWLDRGPIFTRLGGVLTDHMFMFDLGEA